MLLCSGGLWNALSHFPSPPRKVQNLFRSRFVTAASSSHTFVCDHLCFWRSQFSQDGRLILCSSFLYGGFPGGTSGKTPPANAGDSRNMSSIPGSGRSIGVGYGNPFQYSCLENSIDRGAWQDTVRGVTKSQTRLSMHPSFMWYNQFPTSNFTQ